MSSVQAKKLGDKYILLDLIGTGGMAEVYRGKLLGDKGFEKLIVIKKLLPHIAQDKEMVRLFIGEARLAALLQHENIAATYDFGELDNNFFLAIEYLFGKDLYTVMQRARECKSPLGPKYALMIASKICEGMDYAHGLKDLQNNPLNIIHRDLTPQNIFITYDGKVKIIDFGIAKAEMLDTRTRAGVVKGKVSYMSPEQLSGAVVDSRSDIFSIGILLYEMISEQRMYRGDTASLIKKCITVEYEHLETVIPGLPPKLYAILHKALARDIESRYQSCAAMQSDIENLLFSMSERPDSRILKKYIRNLFEHEYESDQKKAIRATDSVWDKDAAPDQDKAVISRPKRNRNVPGDDKTVLYDTTKDGVQRTSSSPGRRLAAIFTKWQDNKEGISSQPLHKKHFLLAASICLIAIMVFLLRDFMREEADIASPPPADKVARPASPPQAPGKKELTNRSSTVKQLLLQAEKALAGNRLLKPKDNCAFKFYQDTLRIDPENRNAKKGLRQIADRYVDYVHKILAEQKFSEAERFIEVALTAFPDHEVLYNLKDHPEIRKQLFIQELFYKAEQRLAIDHLTTPADDSAFSYYNKILTLDADSAQARAGLRKIADRYASMADQAYRKFDFMVADEYVTSGLVVMPDHSRLLILKRELTKSKPEVIYKGMEKNIEALTGKKPEKFIKDMEKNIEAIFSD